MWKQIKVSWWHVERWVACLQRQNEADAQSLLHSSFHQVRPSKSCGKTAYPPNQLPVTCPVLSASSEYHNSNGRSQNCEKRLLSPSLLSVRPSVRTEQLGSHFKNFPKFWYLSFLQKSFDKINVSLKSNKSNGYFISRCVYICDRISPNYS